MHFFDCNAFYFNFRFFSHTSVFYSNSNFYFSLWPYLRTVPIIALSKVAVSIDLRSDRSHFQTIDFITAVSLALSRHQSSETIFQNWDLIYFQLSRNWPANGFLQKTSADCGKQGFLSMLELTDRTFVLFYFSAKLSSPDCSNMPAGLSQLQK